MKKSQYYYEDVTFQMELNLQTIRRDLVTMLEEYDNTIDDCSCNQLKHSSVNSSSDYNRTTTLSSTSSDSAVSTEKPYTRYIAAPPPQTLPTPKWNENKTRSTLQKANASKVNNINLIKINAWVKASLPNTILPNSKIIFPVLREVLDKVNYTWPPFPKSIWSKERLKETKEREDTLGFEGEEDGDNSVKAFFKCFNDKKIHKTVFTCN